MGAWEKGLSVHAVATWGAAGGDGQVGGVLGGAGGGGDVTRSAVSGTKS